jgi:hypothetical protein
MMNSARKLVEKLNVFRQTHDPGQAALKISGKDGGYLVKEQLDNIHLQVEIEDFDKFSYMVRSVSMTHSQTLAAPVKDVLLRQAGEIERQISYLLEGFRLVEVDEVNGTAQIRSITPYKKGDERLYYEVLLRGGNSLTFTRYRKQHPTGKRQIVPSHLTQEIFERLVDDLVAVIRLR